LLRFSRWSAPQLRLYKKIFPFFVCPLFRYSSFLRNLIFQTFKNTIMSNFMLLFRGGLDPKSSSPEEMQSNMQKWMGWVEDLQKKGIYVAGEALLPTGKTLRKGNLVTDGPFAESKEIVGGFFIVKADNIDQAITISKDCPDLPLGGSVEVRDVMVF
jgi:hypothetical protein